MSRHPLSRGQDARSTLCNGRPARWIGWETGNEHGGSQSVEFQTRLKSNIWNYARYIFHSVPKDSRSRHIILQFIEQLTRFTQTSRGVTHLAASPPPL